MKRLSFLATSLVVILSACTPTNEIGTPLPQLVRIQYTAAAQPRLTVFYECADLWPDVVLTTEQRVASSLNIESADVILRLGGMEGFSGNAFVIDHETIYVAVNQDSPLQELDVAQTRLLFLGQSDSEFQVWVFDSGDDIQQVFNEFVLNGAVISSNSRLATSLQQVFDTLSVESNAIGLLPSYWLKGNTRQIFDIPDVPVLAILPEQSTEKSRNILACVQEKNGNPTP